MSDNLKASMGATNTVLDKIVGKSRGMGVILGLVDKKTYLRGNLVALPVSRLGESRFLMFDWSLGCDRNTK